MTFTFFRVLQIEVSPHSAYISLVWVHANKVPLLTKKGHTCPPRQAVLKVKKNIEEEEEEETKVDKRKCRPMCRAAASKLGGGGGGESVAFRAARELLWNEQPLITEFLNLLFAA